jgi:hypothetical protein
MNEKLLNKLIKKATKKTKFQHEMGGFYHEDVFNKKKFAELIVKECERVAKNPQWYDESPSCGWRNPIRHVCKVMKEHLGVKE